MATTNQHSLDPHLYLEKIAAGRTIDQYSANQLVFSQGEAGDAVFYIQEGTAKLTVVSEFGKEAIIAVLGAKDFLGESCLSAQPVRTASASTVTDAVIMRIDKAEMIRALHDDSAFSDWFIAYLVSRTARFEADLVDQLFNSSERRLARTLLLLANFGKDTKPEPILAKISQETLAEMIGTTRSRVSFFMNKFRRLGLISYNGRIEVHQALLNVILHENPHINEDS